MKLSFKNNYLDLLLIKTGLSVRRGECRSFFFGSFFFRTKEVLSLAEIRSLPEIRFFLSFFHFEGNISDK